MRYLFPRLRLQFILLGMSGLTSNIGALLGTGPGSAEKKATGNFSNIFNFGLGNAKSNESEGTSNLGTASDYFTKLLTAGRTDTALRSAPAVNATLDKADAARRQESTTGTARTGGTAELNREAGAGTSASIDSIINSNMMGGRAQGAQGLANIGAGQQTNATQLLGLSEQAADPLLKEGSKETGLLSGLGAGIASDIPWAKIASALGF